MGQADEHFKAGLYVLQPSPSQNVSLTQDPSDFPLSAVDECEIFGLDRMIENLIEKYVLRRLEYLCG